VAAAGPAGCLRRAEMPAGALAAAIGPLLPILRGVTLAEVALGAVVPWDRLIRLLEADLGSGEA
jgi:hypothetical protein